VTRTFAPESRRRQFYRAGGSVQYRIRRFGIQSAAITVAVLYFVLALIVVPIIYLAARGRAPEGLPSYTLLIWPLLYAVIGYVFTAIGCMLYNIIAGWTGGVALTLEPDGGGE
jgi:hypothetical protein